MQQSNNDRRLGWPWTVTLCLAFLCSIGFFFVFALRYLLPESKSLSGYKGLEVWLLIHVATASVALLVGPFLLWMGATRTAMAVHRKLGMVYLSSIAISSVTTFYLAVNTQVSWVFGMGLGGLGFAWVVTTGMAYIAVRLHNYRQHQEWMIRSYVVTLAFVFLRMFTAVFSILEVGQPLERLNAASWFCWAFPLLITEAVIQGRKLFTASVPS